MGAVGAIHESLRDLLEIARRTIHPYSCAIYFLDERGTKLRLKEVLTESRQFNRRSLKASEGVFAAAVKQGQTVALTALRDHGKTPGYYGGPEPVRALAAVPIFDEAGDPARAEAAPRVTGLLVADRTDADAFDEPALALLQSLAGQARRALTAERLLLATARDKAQQERLFRASERLNHALTLDQVYVQFFASAREMLGYDFAVITLVLDGKRGEQAIVAADGEETAGLAGQTFEHSAGLCAAAVRSRQVLPASAYHRMDAKKKVVFDETIKAPPLGTLKVIPLLVKDQAVGTIVVGARAVNAFGREAIEMLHVIANQAAICVENAKIYRQMERMATTDGLTGIFNRRTFNERLNEAIARAQRTGQKLSLIMCDVDHFKKVNDTYGHDAGDEVIKRVAKLLKESARETDSVARYGGEEFCVIMEVTDGPGAVVMAERLRESIKQQVFTANGVKFGVTQSFGVAVYPTDAENAHDLLVSADKALYHSKQNGRDRVALYDALT